MNYAISLVRRTIILILGSVCIAACPLRAQFNFITNNSGIVITRYTGSGADVAIPSMVNGLPVVGIDVSAMSGCQSVTNVTIPDSVTSIELMAFYYSTNLVGAVLGNGVTNVGQMAFSRCSSLRAVTMGNGVVQIGSSAFNGCTPLSSINLPVNLAKIGDFSFEACASLENVTIPVMVNSIGVAPFMGCSRLTNINVDPLNTAYCSQDGVLYNADKSALIQFPCGRSGGYSILETATQIGGYAFQLSGNLTNVTIPGSVTNIGPYAFLACSNLQAIWVDASNSSYCTQDGVLLNSNRTILLQCPGGRTGSMAIPSGVTTIGVRALSKCAKLATVVVPASVTNISSSGFSLCSITNLFFRGNPCDIGSGAFGFDPDLAVYYLPGTVGWTNPWHGLPALLWNPQVLLGDGSFGVRTNQFGFTIAGTTNIPIVVEGSDGLSGGSWIPLATSSLSGGAIYFADPNWTNYRGRLYRIRSP